MRAIVAGMKYQAPRKKIEIVADVLFPQGSNDATVQAAQILAMKPDFVFMGLVGAFEITATNQLLDLGFRPDQIIHNTAQTLTVLGYGKRRSARSTARSSTPASRTSRRSAQEVVKEFSEQVGVPSFGENYCYTTPSHHQGGAGEGEGRGSREIPRCDV